MSWKEKDFEESMQPSIDNIYTNCFSNIDNIKRNIRTNENSKSMFMDSNIKTITRDTMCRVLSQLETIKKVYIKALNELQKKNFQFYGLCISCISAVPTMVMSSLFFFFV